jgi:16S rRNA (cytosine1402-N4)-methyltransferase
MTFGDPEDYPFTASDIINGWDEKVLADIFFGYGEERFARRIAKEIVTTRKSSPITTTFELVEVIDRAIPAVAKRKRLHPATKTFQALRIAVNDELEVLESFIKEAFDNLAINGRLAIITFHSIEDRIVKHSFRDLQTSGSGLVLTKKPIEPTEKELNDNPRARSAKLRIISRVE